jgi:hypothetical protein
MTSLGLALEEQEHQALSLLCLAFLSKLHPFFSFFAPTSHLAFSLAFR